MLRLGNQASRRYTCEFEECGYSTRSVTGIRLHMWHSHGMRVNGKVVRKERVPVCEVCSKVLRSADAVRRHYSESGHTPSMSV